MFRFTSFLSIVALACISISAAGQAAPATPAPTTTQPQTTIRATSDLVVVDVTVEDGQQNPVHHLATTDFTVLEDGKPQTVKVFEEHNPPAAVQLPPAPKLGPGSFTNYSATPSGGALDILLFDKLNTPMNAQMDLRSQVLKYLKEAPAGRRTAIFALTTELKLLQGFTSDPELLRSLVQGKKGNAGASPLMNNAMEGDQPGADDMMMDTMSDALGNDPDAATIIANLQQFEAQQQSFQLQLRARYTLDALNQLARYMSNLPGRKNLIWFSGSFPVSILPDADLQNPFAIVASAEDEFRETVDLLARSQVAVYPIDARGLMTPPMMNVSQRGSTMNRTPNGFAKANSQFFQNTAEEHGTMMQMAEATGGKAFVNTNDLKTAISKALDAGSNYYTLAYTPANKDWNGSYRKIEVKLDHPGVKLAYRRGYFADDLTKPKHRGEPQNALPGTSPYSAIRAAMMRGAPDPTQLLFVADVRPSNASPEDTPAKGNQSSPKVKGPYRQYAVHFMINPRVIDCEANADGEHHCALEFLTFVYDADGTLINMQTNGIQANISGANFDEALHRNFVFEQQISVPVKGEHYLRVGICDMNNDHVGALELPVAAVAKLAPIAEGGAGTPGSAAPAAAKPAAQPVPASNAAPAK